MGPVTDLGVVFRPQSPPERLREIALAADQAGLDELWLWEDCFYEGGIASASAALAWTRRLRVGIGLLPVPLRNVALTAMEVAALLRLFPGRAVVGVGHGVQDWMAQVGARADSPMTLLREHLTALRALLGGERVTVRGRYVHLDDVALDWPPPQGATLLAGATGPRTLQLSGELADGTILTADTSPDGVRSARTVVGAAPHRVVCYVVAATGPGAAERAAAEARRSGCSAAGDAKAVAEAVQRYADAGADAVVLQPTPDEPDLEGFVRFVAEEVRPLVR
jgi:alkanesulfonate monooxygenase SsuD/methylene tetrahydromethanopterin reductase-like flavin-dependent oxidoreductase (luciferase family)